MGFETPLYVRTLKSGAWKVTRPLIWSRGDLRVHVKQGFITDFDSLPRLPLIYWLAKGRTRKAAVLHDKLYSTGEYSRRMADLLFWLAMEDEGVHWWHRWWIWLGVRLFGWWAWRQHRQAAAEVS